MRLRWSALLRTARKRPMSRTARGAWTALVNNAAVAIDRGQPAAGLDFECVRTMLDANLVGAWRPSAAAVPEMRKNGYGRIVNITSHLGSLSNFGAGNVSYRVSKTGLSALTGILAAELEEGGIWSTPYHQAAGTGGWPTEKPLTRRRTAPTRR